MIQEMSLRAMLFGMVLAVSEAVRAIFRYRPRTVALYVLRDLELPPYFYLKVDEKVFAVRLKR